MQNWWKRCSGPTEMYPPRLVATISRMIAKHERKTRGVPFNAIESGVCPHVDDDTVDVSFEQIRMLVQRFFDQ